MFNRITTLALAAISTQAIKLESFSQVDTEAEYGNFDGGWSGFAQVDAEADEVKISDLIMYCHFSPNHPRCENFGGLAQVDAEADAEFPICLFDPQHPSCRGLAQANAEAEAEQSEWHLGLAQADADANTSGEEVENPWRAAQCCGGWHAQVEAEE